MPSDIPTSQLVDTSDLLRTKLRPPRPRATLVQRESLLARLTAGLSGKLTVLAAPAGFGKTTLVSQWLASQSAEFSVLSSEFAPSHPTQFSILNSQFKVAWLSLDEGDDDPIRFWRYVISACQEFDSELGREALALLCAPPERPFLPTPLKPALTLFLNDLAGLNRDGLLVLEDYHAIRAPKIHETLAFVLDQLPARLHLVVVSRCTPPLPLARLRARGELCELDADDLRFSPTEIAAFVAQTLPFQLSPAALAALGERTEGWAAGLRLALLALPEHTKPQQIAQALGAFHGSRPAMADYLAADVLDGQPASIQTFLLQTSILSRLTASLCDAVTGRPDSADLLARVERANLFLLPLDDTQGWYRYHALFAEAMRHAARQRLGEAALRELYARASLWYEQRGLLPDAIDAALEAQAWPRAAALLERVVEAHPIIEPHEPHTLRRWLDRLSEAVLHQHPLLCFSAGMVLLRSSDQPRAAIMGQVEALGQHAEQAWRAEGNTARLGELYAARALFSLWQGRIDRAIGWAQQALPMLPATERFWRGACMGFAGKGQLDEGQLDAARRTLLEALALNEETVAGSRPAIRAHTILLGEVCAGQAEPHQAAALYRQALSDALDAGDLSDQAPARLGLAQLAYVWNDLAGAESGARAALDLSQQIADQAGRVEAVLLLARVQVARGAPQQAQQLLAELLAQLSPHRTPLLYRAALAEQARLLLANHDLAAVQRWVANREQGAALMPQSQREQEALLVARLLIAQGELADALRLLDELRAEAQAAGRIRSLVEIQLLMALAYTADQRATPASQLLRAALLRAQSAGDLRLFLDEGPVVANLLRGLVPTLREQPIRSFAQALLQAFVHEQAPHPDPAAALSAQERRVLSLLASGRSNPEIAQELVVSVNTVKTQLKQIFRKLGATSRRDACAHARSLNLV